MEEAALLTIHIDGASRGNPGPAAFAYVIARDGQPVVEEAECLGRTTNNIAEYTALVRALERAAALGGKRLFVRSDSELLVKQMNGLYQVKNDKIRALYDEARRLRSRFAAVSIAHVPRAENSRADRLCNEVLDGQRDTEPRPASRRASGGGTRLDAVREEAVACLRAAAEAWSRGSPGTLSPEAVWEQLASILEENRVLRAPGRGPG
jgi:ribonuclease HI